MKEITLWVDGMKMTYSEEELVAILEEHLIVTQKKRGKYFDVIPSSIDRSLFQEKRTYKYQEGTRQIILEAFDEVDKHPEKYAKPFKFIIPKKTWSCKTVGELKKLAEKLGDRIANWVEWALFLAQRISNGETWVDICNKPDTEKNYLLIKGKNGSCKVVGGSLYDGENRAASNMRIEDFLDYFPITLTVPAVVARKDS